MIRRLAFASCYVYSPAGTGVVCARSRLLCALLKAGEAQYLIKYAIRVHQQALESSRLAGFFLQQRCICAGTPLRAWTSRRHLGCGGAFACARARRAGSDDVARSAKDLRSA